MKAFKLASAFAVTGLALAVSGQAMAADTTTEWTWDGKVVFSADLMNNNTDAEKAIFDHAAGAGMVAPIVGSLSNTAGSRGSNGNSSENLDVVVNVANGGFSGKLKIESSAVTFSDFVYEEGAIMFGDIASVVTTEGAIKGMDTDQAYTSDIGFRYTAGGLQVQAFGGYSYASDTTVTSSDSAAAAASQFIAAVDMGLEFAYTGSTDMVTYTVDAQYAEGQNNTGSLDTSKDEALDSYMGVNVSAMATDSVTIDAGYTSRGDLSSLALMATYAADAITAYGRMNQDNADTSVFTLGGAYAFDAGSVYVDYTLDYTTKAGVDKVGAKNFGVKLAGAADAMTWGANADYALDTETYSLGVNVGVAAEMADLAASYKLRENETTELKASATHTTEGGATLALAYELDNGADPINNFGDDASNDVLSFTAAYSF